VAHFYGPQSGLVRWTSNRTEKQTNTRVGLSFLHFARSLVLWVCLCLLINRHGTCQKGEVDENKQRLGAPGSTFSPCSTSPLTPVWTKPAVSLQTSATFGQGYGAAATAQARASSTPRHRRHRRRRRRSAVLSRRTVLARPRGCYFRFPVNCC